MSKFANILKSFSADESGAVAAEYAVLLVLIAAALIIAVTALSGAISDGMAKVTDCLQGATTCPGI